MSTPKFDRIVAKGNRGHFHVGFIDSTITCADGFTLSVIAGGGAYCLPRPSWCSCAYSFTPAARPMTIGDRSVPHDYPGPYSDVEVMCALIDEWDEWESGGVYAYIPADVVRALILAHGGEGRP